MNLKTFAPVLWSKTFWGFTLSAVFKIFALYGWIDTGLMEILATWVFTVTGVNVIWKGAKKVALTKQE